ncbi:MAG: UPF0182 family protein, partial [Actinomycetota bacterium]|nr:UPF0182 family protein [Actinomycetota bacterium]
YRKVYSGILWTRIWLFLIFGFLMALIIGGNLVIAYMLRPPFRPMSTEQQNLERYRIMVEPRKKVILAAVLAFTLFIAGMSAQGNWQTWLMWLNGGSFGVTDPQFHMDISFFAWDYPAYRVMLGFGFSAILFALVLSVAVHYLTGAIRLQTPGPKITPAARRHLTALVFVFMALKAIAYWLDRYGLVFSSRSTFTGASYTDVHASLQAKTILFWLAILIAAGVLASMWLRSAVLPAIGFAVLLVLSILISGIYPAIIQQVSVKPNASAKEKPYIGRNIQATRQAYGIQTTTNVNYLTYNVSPSPLTSAVVSTNPTVSDIRILDPNQISPTFTQQQQVRNVYGFANKLAVDRYTDASGQTKDYVVGVRELSAANLTGNQGNWINSHTVYTHGYGFVAAAASVDVTNNKALYAQSNIPPVGTLGLAQLTQPAAYFGQLLPSYSIVGAQGTPQEFDANDAAKVTYAGGGGVSLGSFFTRLAFAVHFKQTNFLLNSSVSAKGARIIFNRDPRERVQKVAPFLQVDGDPYPFIDSASGHIMWMVDAYTTINNYPYSERNSLSSLTSNSLSATGKTATQPNDTINYIRNSVKATVDAYTGKVTLYQWDQQDPVLKTWMKTFPGIVQPQSSMPASVLSHVRYPEDLFQVQRSLLGSYHVDDPVTFYNVGDKWTVPVDPNDTSANQPPYYVLAAPPDGTSNSPQFQLTSPMIVNSKQNLAAFISVDSDPGPNYGKITVLKVPTGTVTNGPEQISNILSTNSVITKDLSLFNAAGGGSSVVHGNLLTLPIGNAFLYVEPLYVQAVSGKGSYPTLQRVLVVYGDKIGYAADLADALANLSQSQVGESISNPGAAVTPAPSTSATPTGTPTGSGTSTGVPPPAPQSQTAMLATLNAAANDLETAYKGGDPVAIGVATKQLQTLLQQYVSKYGSPTPTPTPSRTK